MLFNCIQIQFQYVQTVLQNGHPSNPYCQGIEGILEAYTRTLRSVQLYGPTNFAPCINHVAKCAAQRQHTSFLKLSPCLKTCSGFRRIAAQHQDGNNYFILLILTDGVITDMPQTTEAIVNVRSSYFRAYIELVQF